jgi:hypothetical protein
MIKKRPWLTSANAENEPTINPMSQPVAATPIAMKRTRKDNGEGLRATNSAKAIVKHAMYGRNKSM